MHKVFLGGIKNAGSGFVPGRDLWRGPKGHGEVTEVTEVTGEVTERSQRSRERSRSGLSGYIWVASTMGCGGAGGAGAASAPIPRNRLTAEYYSAAPTRWLE